MTRIHSMCIAAGVAASVGGAVAAARSIPLTHVPTANPKAAGYAPASQLSPELRAIILAQGSTALENPQGVTGWYGYQNDAPSPTNVLLPQMVPANLAAPTETQKTEPDKNTYLVLRNQRGGDSNYDYGRHFLFQGHEIAVRDAQGRRSSYITRINLDADTVHRVTLMATQDVDGLPLDVIDGSTWDPFAQKLLFTTEDQNGPTYSATLDVPSRVEDVSGALGRGGYEGIQNDSDGNLWIVEDIGGATKPAPAGVTGPTNARIPNSFVYRYVPRRPGDLENGKLQVLQVLNAAGQPITQASQAALCAPDQVALRSYGTSFATKWITIHDTALNGNASFNANVAAKAANGTPFKRPENGVFRPGSNFREFYFDETGDTNATSFENGGTATSLCTAGGWTSLFKVTQENPSANEGRISLFYEGDQAHAGFDNVQFLSRDVLLAVEDAGDTLHGQRNALDSGYAFDVRVDYSSGAQPVRWLAEGRDPSATIDSANGGFGKNDGDNEITGVHVSDGDPTTRGILGARIPHVFQDGWRWFWNQQHGDNFAWEVVPSVRDERGDFRGSDRD